MSLRETARQALPLEGEPAMLGPPACRQVESAFAGKPVPRQTAAHPSRDCPEGEKGPRLGALRATTKGEFVAATADPGIGRLGVDTPPSSAALRLLGVAAVSDFERSCEKRERLGEPDEVVSDAREDGLHRLDQSGKRTLRPEVQVTPAKKSADPLGSAVTGSSGHRGPSITRSADVTR